MIHRRDFIKNLTAGIGALSTLTWPVVQGCSKPARKPNIILIMADDLGYNELGCYGQTKIKTPHIDRLAEQGMRFTQFYSGSPVCAPSRCVLMTGMHTGHAFVRDNREIGSWESFNGQLPLPTDTETMAELLKQNGYTTAAIGKWGLGYPGSEGDPVKQGFDLFYGYNCQRHAHNYYPRFLWKNEQKVELEGNDRGLTGKHYAPDLMEEEALSFIEQNEANPFFLYFATPVPHLALQVPEDSIEEYIGEWEDPEYDGKKGYLLHPTPRAAYAGMVTRMDRTVGRIVKRIEEAGLKEDTVIIFTSDNGPTFVGGYDRDFFEGAGDLRSHKGYVYEGGIRVPLVVSWPGKIKAGSTSAHVAAFQDFLPTLLELAGTETANTLTNDGISFSNTLLQKPSQKKHEYLYMEFPSYGGQQMVRKGPWKAVRQNLQKQHDAPIELYNLETDVAEQHDISAEQPALVREIWQIMKQEHVPSEEFPLEALDKAVKPANVA